MSIAAETAKPTPAARTTYLIKRVERGVKSLLDDQLRSLGITTNQYTALSVLRSRSGISSAELARRSFVSAQAMNQVITVLEDNGLIMRKPDPKHRKILQAYITPTGQQLLDSCERLIDAAEAELFQELTPAQVRTFNSLLTTCVGTLNELHHTKLADPEG
jgi:DNA-binding MarR family transcriptional regulator